MKRLRSYLLKMDNNETTYKQIYEGETVVHIPPKYDALRDEYIPYPPEIHHFSQYYSGDIAFDFDLTNKLAKDKPTVTIMIPLKNLIKGETTLKRLEGILSDCYYKHKSWAELYNGTAVVHPIAPPDSYLESLPQYWHEDISMVYSCANKKSEDKPVIELQIPTRRLGASETVSELITEPAAKPVTELVTAAADCLLREFLPYIDEPNALLYNRSRPDTENGRYYIVHPGGEVLMRNAAFFAVCPQKDYINGPGNSIYLIEDDVERPPLPCFCIRLQVQLPRKKIAKVIQMLCKDLPKAVDRFIAECSQERLEAVLDLAKKQLLIREYLRNSSLCAFIANGSILPRAKGSDKPLESAIPFVSPPEDEIEIAGIKGMGIQRGVTVITGGGYSGKSTLLDAISAGIYDHVAGDGRELCISDETAMTISAEDGRCVKNVNISPFIKWLPSGDVRDFSTDHASGSTSQAANIMEAADFGAKLLLIDEDRSATNFMIRDAKMKELIAKEPITPFTDRVRELHTDLGVSTILVIGGSGEYLSVADRVYMMEDYVIRNVTHSARRIGGDSPQDILAADWKQSRVLTSKGFTSYPDGMGSEKLIVSDMGIIAIGNERIDVRGLHDIITPRQLTALGFMLRYLEVRNADEKIDISSVVSKLYEEIERDGLDVVFSSYFTDCERFLDLPREIELRALISRMRGTDYSASDE